MIIATAGHIDHGKTLLVRALTGIDADRLPEEKRRGMTIDLGFAYQALPGGSMLGFVDVPGHERFIRHMLAGVTGIDFALLVVAADDGPMPQTVEHLAILDLLGIARGAVALTKIDRVSAARRDEVEAAIRELLAETALSDAPIFPVSGLTNEGIPALRRHLERVAQVSSGRTARGHFRLAIDRCFTLRGAGLIVTGTAFAGTAKVGDQLLLSPQGIPVRVRSIRAQNRETHAGQVGQRCALNIAGQELRRTEVRRGDWILAEPVHAPTRRLDARIRMLSGETPVLRDRAPVHIHLGATDVTGRVALLAGRTLEPGAAGLVQILLDREIGALHGDRLILRDQSAQATIGGGQVVDPFPAARGRRRPERLAALQVMLAEDPAAALAGLLETSQAGIDLGLFARARNLGPADLGALRRRVPMALVGGADAPLALAQDRWEGLRARALKALSAWHAARPDSPGPDLERWRRSLDFRPPAPLFAAVAADLVAAGRVVRDAGSFRLPQHSVAFSSGEAALWDRIEPLLVAGGIRPPIVRELAAALGIDHRPVEALLRRAARMGRVLSVADNRFFPPEAVASLAEIAEALAREAASGTFTAAAYKDRSGIGRNLTIQLLEYFDKQGFTRREGEVRRIVRPAAELFPRP